MKPGNGSMLCHRTLAIPAYVKLRGGAVQRCIQKPIAF